MILGNLKAGEGMPPSDVFARKSEFDVGRAAVRRVFKDVGKPIPGGQRQNVLWRLARPPRRRVNGRASIPRNVKEPTLPKKKRGERGKGKNTAAKHKKVVDLALTRRFSSLRQLQDALPFLMSRGASRKSSRRPESPFVVDAGESRPIVPSRRSEKIVGVAFDFNSTRKKPHGRSRAVSRLRVRKRSPVPIDPLHVHRPFRA